MKKLPVYESGRTEISLDIADDQKLFLHGGNLDDFDFESHKVKRYEYGPGTYVTDRYQNVQRYTKGNRKLYLLTIEKGNNINDVLIYKDTIYQFLESYVPKSKLKDIMFRIKSTVLVGDCYYASSLEAILLNQGIIKTRNTQDFLNFLVRNDVDWGDASHNNYIIYDISTIKNVQRIMPYHDYQEIIEAVESGKKWR